MTVAQVLQYKGYRVGPDLKRADAVVSGGEIEQWAGPAPQPDAAVLAAWEAEPGFGAWEAQHGGDPTLTTRRELKELLESDAEIARLLRAVLIVVMKEFNTLRQRHFIAALTKAEVLEKIKAELDAGTAD